MADQPHYKRDAASVASTLETVSCIFSLGGRSRKKEAVTVYEVPHRASLDRARESTSRPRGAATPTYVTMNSSQQQPLPPPPPAVETAGGPLQPPVNDLPPTVVYTGANDTPKVGATQKALVKEHGCSWKEANEFVLDAKAELSGTATLEEIDTLAKEKASQRYNPPPPKKEEDEEEAHSSSELPPASITATSTSVGSEEDVTMKTFSPSITNAKSRKGADPDGLVVTSIRDPPRSISGISDVNKKEDPAPLQERPPRSIALFHRHEQEESSSSSNNKNNENEDGDEKKSATATASSPKPATTPDSETPSTPPPPPPSIVPFDYDSGVTPKIGAKRVASSDLTTQKDLSHLLGGSPTPNRADLIGGSASPKKDLIGGSSSPKADIADLIGGSSSTPKPDLTGLIGGSSSKDTEDSVSSVLVAGNSAPPTKDVEFPSSPPRKSMDASGSVKSDPPTNRGHDIPETVGTTTSSILQNSNKSPISKQHRVRYEDLKSVEEGEDEHKHDEESVAETLEMDDNSTFVTLSLGSTANHRSMSLQERVRQIEMTLAKSHSISEDTHFTADAILEQNDADESELKAALIKSEQARREEQTRHAMELRAEQEGFVQKFQELQLQLEAATQLTNEQKLGVHEHHTREIQLERKRFEERIQSLQMRLETHEAVKVRIRREEHEKIAAQMEVERKVMDEKVRALEARCEANEARLKKYQSALVDHVESLNAITLD